MSDRFFFFKSSYSCSPVDFACSPVDFAWSFLNDTEFPTMILEKTQPNTEYNILFD